jgi:hypothetical protein
MAYYCERTYADPATPSAVLPCLFPGGVAIHLMTEWGEGPLDQPLKLGGGVLKHAITINSGVVDIDSVSYMRKVGKPLGAGLLLMRLVYPPGGRRN